MFPMSVLPTTRCPPVRGSPTVRPTSRAFSTYAALRWLFVTMSAYASPTHSWCIVQPHAVAPAPSAVRTRSFRSAREVIVSERTYHSIAARLGTMLGFSPASVKMPWTRSVGRMCWRSAATPTYPRTAASRAFRPMCGAAAACDSRPWYSTMSCCRAIASIVVRSASAECTIIAASTPSRAPLRAMMILPPPPSSAGVPRYRIRPPHASATAARPTAAPRPAAAMTLCPQPCPMPGSASYSDMTQTVGPVPLSPAKPVGQPCAPSSTGMPSLFECRTRSSEANRSSWFSSGCAWMSRLVCTSTSAISVMRPRTLSLSSRTSGSESSAMCTTLLRQTATSQRSGDTVTVTERQ